MHMLKVHLAPRYILIIDEKIYGLNVSLILIWNIGNAWKPCVGFKLCSTKIRYRISIGTKLDHQFGGKIWYVQEKWMKTEFLCGTQRMSGSILWVEPHSVKVLRYWIQ
jgi:hypothetical protein